MAEVDIDCQQDTRAIVHEIYDAYARRDFECVAARIDDNIQWVIYGPRQIFPFTGPRDGKREVLEALAMIAVEYAIESYIPKIVLVDGDRAAVLSEVVFRRRASGRALNFRIANFLRLRGGRVVEFEEFVDTFDVAEQALGRWIDVS